MLMFDNLPTSEPFLIFGYRRVDRYGRPRIMPLGSWHGTTPQEAMERCQAWEARQDDRTQAAQRMTISHARRITFGSPVIRFRLTP
jgi:hypothetical protein